VLEAGFPHWNILVRHQKYLMRFLYGGRSFCFIGNPHLFAASHARGGDNSLAQSHSTGRSREIAAAMLAKSSLELRRHPYPNASADLPGDLDIPVGPLGMKGVLLRCQLKEPFHALPGYVSGLCRIILASHGLNPKRPGIKPISMRRMIFLRCQKSPSPSPSLRR
jgi:hypothetical protein